MKYSLVIFGPPNCGKDTYSKLLSEKLNIEHLCAGQLIKEKLNDDPDWFEGKYSKEIIGTENFSPSIVSSIGNELTPGSDMALTFKLNLPEPCNGDFNTGQIYFWGEAV